ncbi:gliding motility lipoprotein GldD [Weeksellaceae bacterium TAE3-ERU29]|nr:gliding motility lipoprotein GldD [Weeksellaceae bacterium TAE3-ERU29]
MKSRNLLISFLILILFSSCKQEIMPKPQGNLRLEYAQPEYRMYNGNCPFTFDFEKKALINSEKDCEFNIYYPALKSTIYFTYEPVKNNLPELLKDSEKSVYEPHTGRATYIDPKIIVRENDKVYGTLYELGGDTALNYQFHLTDSTNNFLRGAVYFNAHPNPDSLAPAIDYMKENVIKLMETLQWK